MSNADYLPQLQCALNESIAYIGDTFIYNGTAYTGIINQIEIYNDLAEGGLKQILAMQIVFPLAAVETAPTTGQLVTIGGTTARIEKVAQDDISYELICISGKY